MAINVGIFRGNMKNNPFNKGPINIFTMKTLQSGSVFQPNTHIQKRGIEGASLGPITIIVLSSNNSECSLGLGKKKKICPKFINSF